MEKVCVYEFEHCLRQYLPEFDVKNGNQPYTLIVLTDDIRG